MTPSEQMTGFWSRLAVRDLVHFLGAVFFTFVVFGFLRDVQELGHFTSSYLTFISVTTGIMAVCYALAMARKPRLWLPVVLAVQLFLEYLGRQVLVVVASPLSEGELPARLRFDATASIVSLFLGYLGFVSFIANQGVRRLRLDTEVALAREIHEVLVPRLTWQDARFELAGASFPAYEVGGDLIDAIRTDRCMTCFVADVSGHGVPAGTLMAALKSAARMRLLGPASIADLLTDLNRVLFAIKRANMFATAACLQIEGSRIEYGLAGHLPILHWSRATRQVLRLTEGQIALGIFESARYEQRPIEVGVGDVLVVVTDGLTEVMDRHDREIGLEGIESVLAAHAEEPLDRLIAQILGLVRRHGPQRDDQTLLLIRILGEAEEQPNS
jgi:stage II sporulation SpoE-like protein